MRRLLLVSQFLSVSELLFDLEPDLRGRTVVYIPTAGNLNPREQALRLAAGRLKSMGLRVATLDIAKAPRRHIHRLLSRAGIIYVGGGNTFYLLQELRRTGADQLLVDRVSKGAVYIGESAGAVVAAPSIEYIEDMDDPTKGPNLRDYQGLGLVDFSVLPHYGTPWANTATAAIIRKYVRTVNLEILRDDQAILVYGDETRVLSS